MDLRLQYQVASGNWIECGGRTAEFLARCERWGGLHGDELVAALLAGEEVRNDPDDWYSMCRSGSAHEAAVAARRAAAPPVRLVQCACGHAVREGAVMAASMGSSCPDCYDRMSD